MKLTDNLTVLSYGATRSGKTAFAGTWPKAYFLAAGQEKGWDTFSDMMVNRPQDFYEEGKAPIVKEIYDAEDYIRYHREAVDLVKKGKVKTLVTDSLTFYADAFLDHQKMQGVEGWDLYGRLLDHIKHVVVETHKLPCHVIWICLADDPRESGDTGGPLIPGQMGKKLPAMCSSVLYHTARDVVDKKTKRRVTKYEVRTRKKGNFPASVRRNSSIADPLPISTYRGFVEALGYEA